MRHPNPPAAIPTIRNLAKHALATLATGGEEDRAYTHAEASAFKEALVNSGYGDSTTERVPDEVWDRLALEHFPSIARAHGERDLCSMCGEDRNLQIGHDCQRPNVSRPRRTNPMSDNPVAEYRFSNPSQGMIALLEQPKIYKAQPITSGLRQRLIDELEARGFQALEHFPTHWNSIAGVVVGGAWEFKDSAWGHVRTRLPDDITAKKDDYVMRFTFVGAPDNHPARHHGVFSHHHGLHFNGKVEFRNPDPDALFDEVVAFLDKFTVRKATPPRTIDRPWRALPEVAFKVGDLVRFAPHTDPWMRGAKSGHIVHIRPDGSFVVSYGPGRGAKALLRREDLLPQ